MAEQSIIINDTMNLEDEISTKKNVFEIMQNKGIVNEVDNNDNDEGDEDNDEGDEDDDEGDDEGDDDDEKEEKDEEEKDEKDDKDEDEGDEEKTNVVDKTETDFVDDDTDLDDSNYEDVSSSDDDNEQETLFTTNLRDEYIEMYHPEMKDIGNTQISALTRIVRNKDGNIIDPLHTTIPFVTKFERTRILGIRADQLENGADPLVDTSEHELDTLHIAEREFNRKILPFIISRPLPDGRIEYWKLSDLEFIE